MKIVMLYYVMMIERGIETETKQSKCLVTCNRVKSEYLYFTILLTSHFKYGLARPCTYFKFNFIVLDFWSCQRANFHIFVMSIFKANFFHGK
jgi:hypothetical protein